MTKKDNSPAARRAAKKAAESAQTNRLEEAAEATGTAATAETYPVDTQSYPHVPDALESLTEDTDEEYSDEDYADEDDQEQASQYVSQATELNASGSISPKQRVTTKKVAEAIAELNLPPHVTSWELEENPYSPGETIIVFYADETPLTYIEVNLENLEDMMNALNQEIILLGNTNINGWTIRKPEDPELPRLLSFTANGGVVATVALDKEFLKAFVPALLKIYDPNKGKGGGFLAWVKKHYILSGLLTVILAALTISSVIKVFF